MDLLAAMRKSIYSPEFYRDLLARPLSFSFKYFYSLALALSLVFTVWFSLSAIPFLQTLMRTLEPAILASYLDELVVTIQGGKASVNVAEPYPVPLPDELRALVGRANESLPENLFVINTKEPFTLEGFRGYDTAILLTEEAFVIRDKDGIRVQELSQVPNVKIDKSSVVSVVGYLAPLLRWLIPVVVFAIFIGLLAFMSAKLVYLLFGALLVWVVGKIRHVKFGYAKAYQIGMHAITLSVLVGALSFLGFPKIPYLFTILFVVMAWLNLAPERAPKGGVA